MTYLEKIKKLQKTLEDVAECTECKMSAVCEKHRLRVKEFEDRSDMIIYDVEATEEK